jgi:hypothetical protein
LLLLLLDLAVAVYDDDRIVAVLDDPADCLWDEGN